METSKEKAANAVNFLRDYASALTLSLGHIDDAGHPIRETAKLIEGQAAEIERFSSVITALTDANSNLAKALESYDRA